MTEKDIVLAIAEKENVVNVLISNFATQCLSVGSATTQEEQNEHRVGLKIASDQLVKFVSTLIAENGNLQLNCGKPIVEVPCNNPDYKKIPEKAKA